MLFRNLAFGLAIFALNSASFASEKETLEFSAVDHALYLLNAAGTHHVLLEAPASLSQNVSLVLPANSGSSGQSLQTDGSGNLSWGDTTFPVVVPGTSNGLVSASGVPANTSGSAISSGFVGETQTLTFSLSNTSCSAGNDTDNTSIVTIPSGNWWISVFVVIDSVPSSGLTGVDGVVWASSSIGTGLATGMVANLPPGRDGFLSSVPRLISFTSSTPISLRVTPIGAGITLRSSGSYVQIVRAS